LVGQSSAALSEAEETSQVLLGEALALEKDLLQHTWMAAHEHL
jgi:hypothetical protein